MQSSTCRAVDEAGRIAGREYGLAESVSRTLAGLLSRQARQKFGAADATGRATLDGLARAFAIDQLEELGDRLLASSSWNEWLAGIVVPPPAEGLPPYTRNLDIDLEPEGPSIDTYLQAELPPDGTMIAHIRIQKWYQPDLDRHLFESESKDRAEARENAVGQRGSGVATRGRAGHDRPVRGARREGEGDAHLHLYDTQGMGDDGRRGDARRRDNASGPADQGGPGTDA